MWPVTYIVVLVLFNIIHYGHITLGVQSVHTVSDAALCLVACQALICLGAELWPNMWTD